VTDEHSQAPPSGEEIHLPGPTILPVVMAIGITFAVIGTTLTWYLSILGVIIFLVTLLMWVRDTRRDISELPEDHTAH
jgi:type IV secretory pathway TrbD component